MRPIIVFDNIIFSLQKSGGISAFWVNLTKRVEQSGRFDCYYIEYPGAKQNLFRQSLTIPSEKIIIGRHLPFNLERLFEPWITPTLLKKPFIFHSSYYRIFTHPNARIVSTFHDLTHEQGGDGNFISRPLMRRIHSKALEKSSGIVCVSESCRNDILSIFPKYSEKRINVAHNAPVNVSISTINTKRDDDYLLFVGARDDYKNFRFTVKLAKESGLMLKVAGAPLTLKEKKYIAKIKDVKVEQYSYPNEAEICALYSDAHSLVYMSDYEGFGIPVTEAQALGCPVIAQRKTAIPEIAGEGSILLDGLNIHEAVDAVKKLGEPTFRKIIIDKGRENVTRFSWDKTAAKYIEIYENLLKK